MKILKRCLDAAKRGVRVRLMADGLILIGEGKTIAAIDSHPNIEVRIFNPFEQQRANRSLKSYQTWSDLIIACTTNSYRNINTEMGILIDSPELAEELSQKIDYLMQPENSWSSLFRRLQAP